MNSATLPPWGQLDESLRKQIADRPIPEAWRGLSSGSLEQQWKQWFEALVHDLSVLLWPTFDERRGKWTTPPNDALIDADFALMKSLWKQLDEPIRGLGPNKTLQRKLFDEEDDHTVIFGVEYERYDPAFPEHLRKDRQFTQILVNGCDRKIGSLHFQLKQKFQRPRPYQVAFIQQRRDFQHEFTRLGPHPSLVSGHCLQGCVAGMSAYLLLAPGLDFASVDVLKQFAVDIGDRRVFAGVHYPSDNLSSWYTAFKLLPHVVDGAALPAARSFLWDAICNKSIVYQAIAEHVNVHGTASPYEKAVTAIGAAAQPPSPMVVGRNQVVPSPRPRASRRLRAPARKRA
jgi:hypothetical protein